MPVTTLSHASSLNPGADLWIFPELGLSKTATRADWYLNFQLAKSNIHRSAILSGELVQLLRQCELPETNYGAQAQDSLLLNSCELLPNRWLVQLSSSNDFGKWCERISEIWTGLRKPTLRVFLPTGLTAGEFQVAWKQFQSFDDFTVVVD